MAVVEKPKRGIKKSVKSMRVVSLKKTSKKLVKEQKAVDVDAICNELRGLQRQRTFMIKSRIIAQNRLRMAIAIELGYTTGMEEEDREKMQKMADKYIKEVLSGGVESPLKGFIQTTVTGFQAFEDQEGLCTKAMEHLVKQLPIAKWIGEKDQDGFGLKSAGQIIGECGNLNNYPNPAKVWKRMGCAPFSKDGETLMGASWKSRGGKKKEKDMPKLSSGDWEEYGYCPRRRSIMWNIGDCMSKLNHGPYRARYLEAKRIVFGKHPEWEWKPCQNADAKGKCKRDCKCGGTGQICGHCHNHGLLLMEKLLLKNFWVEWRRCCAV